jgi:exosortase D (VPLPA-CTERM-specific)
VNVFKVEQKMLWKPFLVGILISFLYATVLVKLGQDWWIDENYSHGLFMPFVIGYIIWLEFGNIRNTPKKPTLMLGFAIILFALVMFLAGNLGAELFTQRLSFVLILAGIVVYFFGFRILQKLTAPFALLLLAIPIPQLILNKIAFPLQMWASQFADSGIKLFNILSVRKGNIIEILPRGANQIVQLEVVEACSGIRSLMTLIALALILGYFTRERRKNITDKWFEFIKDSDFWRIVILMFSAIPIALLTNAVRVMTTGIMTYHFGIQAAVGFWHELAGWLVYIVAVGLMLSVNFLLKSLIRKYAGTKLKTENQSTAYTDIYEFKTEEVTNRKLHTANSFYLLVTVLVCGGIFINWFAQVGESQIARQSLHEIPAELGEWRQRGNDIRFDAATESVLRASDYMMRDYSLLGKTANLYIGYYASQRSGATYHSPQNCLPGTGWEMRTPQLVEIKTPAGRSFMANSYIVQNGRNREILIYWYQGRGRVNASEYQDKIHMILDSVLKRRSDGAMVRVMVPTGENESRSLQEAVDLASIVTDLLPPFIPD